MALDDSQFQQRMQKIEALVDEIKAFAGSDKFKAAATELVSLVMELHGDGLRRILDILNQSSPTGSAAVGQFTRDPLLANLLVLHGLHPDDLACRVERGLAEARGYLRSHGGDVELVSIDEGHVLVRLVGNCHGCASSAQTMKHTVEDAIYEFAPDVVAVEVESPSEPIPQAAGFVALDKLLA